MNLFHRSSLRENKKTSRSLTNTQKVLSKEREAMVRQAHHKKKETSRGPILIVTIIAYRTSLGRLHGQATSSAIFYGLASVEHFGSQLANRDFAKTLYINCILIIAPNFILSITPENKDNNDYGQYKKYKIDYIWQVPPNFIENRFANI